MKDNPSMVIITPSWAGDLDHFRLMRASLEQSPLAVLDHYVVIQDEDVHLFAEFRGRNGLKLLSTRDILPASIEQGRVRARWLSHRLGRNMTRMCGSLKRMLAWPQWPSHTGWHTQQFCKLMLASTLGYDKAIIIDSDVIVTRTASQEDFLGSAGYVCFASFIPRTELKGKVKKWVGESEYLTDTKPGNSDVNVYFDTPFVFECDLLKEALGNLQSRYGKPWYQVLLERPPRRWSEFGIYKAFLEKQAHKRKIEWRTPAFCHYLFTTTDSLNVVETVKGLLKDTNIHYVTIHSQASGRHPHDAGKYLSPLLSLIENRG